MLAAPNIGPDYVRAFDAIFPDLAKRHAVVLYPFFLDGVVADAKLNQADGLHPTAAGVDSYCRAHSAEGRRTDRPGAGQAPPDLLLSSWARTRNNKHHSVMPRLFTGIEIPTTSGNR